MTRPIMLVPNNVGVGLTTVALGLMRAIDKHGVRVAFYKPVTQRLDNISEQALVTRTLSNVTPPPPIDAKRVERMLSDGRRDDLLEEIVERYERSAEDADVVIIQGLVSTQSYPYADRLNLAIYKALGADVAFIATPRNISSEKLADQIEISARHYGGMENPHVLGCIFNKLNAPDDADGITRLDLAYQIDGSFTEKIIDELSGLRLFQGKHFNILGLIPFHIHLVAPRAKDVANFLQAKILHKGELDTRRVTRITLCARSVSNMLDGLKPGALLVTSGDRSDIIIATCLAALNGTNIAALLLTGDYALDEAVEKFCAQAIETGLPILSVETDSMRTAINLQNLNLNVPIDDKERIETVKNYVANYFDEDWLSSLISEKTERHFSPAAFRFSLTEKSRQTKKRIILPEGNEPRTIHAANICGERDIAECILLGKKSDILRIAESNDIVINENVRIIDPSRIRYRYVDDMVELRKHRGITPIIAKEQLQDNVTLATMMLQRGVVDGLVSGAIHTTASTIRPALQLIKTSENAKLVSSIFFMCMPDQVLVYGDCAVNPNPNASELADIAIQSADSAKAFGITPRVAMISYSTGTSGSGIDVDKVRQATELVKKERPDILIDGPLQYDAALIERVAKDKAPDSPVAGKATVFIFPDLNTGNTTYKAVQRSANVLCIGPMLQGLRKPVNDLSRGATVDDIVYTIAITAIQSGNAS